MKLIGIDDAGRGPVLGPMVLAGVLMDEHEEVEVAAFGAKDSKLLTPANRKRIGDKIRDRFESHLELSTPREIDESTNLNYLEAIKAAMIINKLTETLQEPVKAIIDCPSVNIEAWSEDVKKLLKKPEMIKLSAEHKADARHPIVGAASILAKEKREEEIEKLRMELDIDFGSGYPADPVTKAFIKKHYADERYKSIIRFSWKTVKKLIEDKNQETLFK